MTFPLAVQQSGADDGPVLLMLAGQANSHDWWTGLREMFDDHYRVVTFDYRGTGGSRGAIRELFYTDGWTGESHLFGDPTMTAEESRAHLRASNRHDAWDVLPLITAPTLVLHGTDDLMVPAANAPLIAGRIPGAVLHLSEGGRHGFFDEFAADVTSTIEDFLNLG